jgi:NAD(P)-dependent dehydrogenase (short-subunit alcohol dehydrogenase family)
VVFTTAVSPLRRLADTDETDWQEILSTNLVGAHLLLRALAPRLDDGTLVAFLSSDSVGTPRPGCVAYASSKAALEELIRGWRFEHPSLRFSCLAVGPTMPTEFGAQFDPDLLMEMFGVWTKLGMVHADVMETDAVAGVLLDTLGLVLAHPNMSLDYLVVRPSARQTKPTDELDHPETTAEPLGTQGG